VKAAYTDTKVFSNIADAGAGLKGDLAPTMIIVGIPPEGRGTTKPGHDAEIQLSGAFPHAALLVEKPISLDSVEELTKVAKVLKERNILTCIGYMLRYTKVAQEMKKIIRENNLTVMATSARYIMAYEFAGTTMARLSQWDKSGRGGPIVEQATHILDLGRYFAPNIQLDSIQTHTIEHFDSVGTLKHLTIEGHIAPEKRTARMTNAIWKYDDGAIGTLVHGRTLHDGDYETELAVMADGWLMRVTGLYSPAPKLFVRKPGTEEELYSSSEDDMYYNELENFVNVIDGKADPSSILSTYEDAIKSYEFTWAIRLKSEEAVKARSK